MKSEYLKQVQLLLDIIPEIAKEDCFSLHGGTAINLFVLDMPRLSVDIDLTFNLIEDRQESLSVINQALIRCSERIITLRPSLNVEHKDHICKLLVSEQGTLIKIEVNMVNRGLLDTSENKMPLCNKAQDMFDSFCSVQVVPIAQLYGGKICAALDRQHPRDLFDVKLLLEANNYNDDIKKGVLYSLICCNRPTHELLAPNLIDQTLVYENQFVGMSESSFSYSEFEQTRQSLIHTIVASLSDDDKVFLMSINQLKPDWSVYNFSDFPSVRWKILNLETFKTQRPEDYRHHLQSLKTLLYS